MAGRGGEGGHIIELNLRLGVHGRACGGLGRGRARLLINVVVAVLLEKMVEDDVEDDEDAEFDALDWDATASGRGTLPSEDSLPQCRFDKGEEKSFETIAGETGAVASNESVRLARRSFVPAGEFVSATEDLSREHQR